MKRGKGMKIMALVDRHGLPLWASTHAANHHVAHRSPLLHHRSQAGELDRDRAYDSDPMDEELRKRRH